MPMCVAAAAVVGVAAQACALRCHKLFTIDIEHIVLALLKFVVVYC